MLDRNLTPPFIIPQNIHLPQISEESISGGVDLHYYESPNLEVFRLELVYRAGSYFDSQPGDAFFVAKLLNAGSKELNSHQIAEGFDKYGGFLEVSPSLERITITLHGMSKYFDIYLEWLLRMLDCPEFPKAEMEIQKNIAVQNLLVNKEKTAFECSRIFREGLFGGTKLGKTLTEVEIKDVNRASLINFWESKIKDSALDIFLTGNFGNKELEKIRKSFSVGGKKKNLEPLRSPIIFPVFENKIENEKNVQSSIRLGRRMINRKHPDFIKFMVTNTLFGGYFGSRLMKNIREEKGLTYGISSSLTPWVDDGIWAIGADVNKQNVDLALQEIDLEIKKIKETQVNFEELERVKNYMAGSIMNSSNTPFDKMDKHKAIKFEALGYDFYDKIIGEILEVNSEQVLEMANKYLHSFSTVIVG